ncbi:hypothetical protein F0562_012279 [Nyssa sinensis]|uniref:EF-hand domain-containing protein n=1 Tax=Nyssa sinensis TaxID=561372 RepID=A0A5J4ZUS0_9ASTE|nr:hypothetical protein F0562_012279 [Nyssa sinensis]
MLEPSLLPEKSFEEENYLEWSIKKVKDLGSQNFEMEIQTQILLLSSADIDQSCIEVAFSQKIAVIFFGPFSYGEVNGLLTRNDFRRAANQVCGVSLTEDVVEIIFHVFDANRDGNLSLDEFVRVLHKRERDIGQPTEAGVMDFFIFLLELYE